MDHDQKSSSTYSSSTISLPKKKNFLQSNRFQAMYIANTSWDFFDAYTQSRPSQLAFQSEEISYDHLDKYLSSTYDANIEEYREANRIITRPIPPMIQQLLQLQSKNGKFESLEKVCSLFQIPMGLPFIRSRHRHYEDWEKATAYGIAAMRQEIEYFQEIVDYHDLSTKWVESGELISDAREHFVRYSGTAKPSMAPSTAAVIGGGTKGDSTAEGFSYLASSSSTGANGAVLDKTQYVIGGGGGAGSRELLEEEKSIHSESFSLITDATIVSSNKAHKQEKKETKRRKKQLRIEPSEEKEDSADTKQASGDDEGRGDEESEGEEEDENDFSTILTRELPAFTELQDSSSRNLSSPANSQLKSMLTKLSGNLDKIKIAEQKAKVEQLETDIINQVMHIEELVRQISFCLDRCVEGYNTAELTNQRYRTFDELTARLGEGFTASVAYDDWRRIGCEGIRPSILTFFNQIQTLAEERLYLAELYLPNGRDWKTSNNIENNRSRWILLWNGHNIVLKVLHCLFLCRESFTITIPLWKAFEGLDLKEKIDDQLQSQPHGRVGIVNLEQKKEWQHTQYLNEFRRRFLELCRDWSFNWPGVPNMREDDMNEQYFHAFLVLFITCSQSIEKSYQWEKRFMASITTLRGQEKHLVGKGNQKVFKELKLPSLEERKARLPVGIADLLPLNGNTNNNNGADPTMQLQPKRGVFYNLAANRIKKPSMMVKKQRSTLVERQALETSLFTIEKAARKESLAGSGRVVDVPSMLKPAPLTGTEATIAALVEGGKKRTSTVVINKKTMNTAPTRTTRSSTILSSNQANPLPSRLSQRSSSMPKKTFSQPPPTILEEKSAAIASNPQIARNQTIEDGGGRKGDEQNQDNNNNLFKKIHDTQAKRFLSFIKHQNSPPSQSPLRSSTASPSERQSSTHLLNGRPSSISAMNSPATNRMTQRLSSSSPLQQQRNNSISPNQPRKPTSMTAIPERHRLSSIRTNLLAFNNNNNNNGNEESEGNNHDSPDKSFKRNGSIASSTMKPSSSSFPLLFASRTNSELMPRLPSKKTNITVLDSSMVSEGNNDAKDAREIREGKEKKNDDGNNNGKSRPSSSAGGGGGGGTSVNKKKKSIMKREELAKEMIQSRKVSRIEPLTATNEQDHQSNRSNSNPTSTTTPTVNSQPRLTKRRPTTGETEIL